MKKQLIFETKLNSFEDYDGFDFLGLGKSLPEKDKVKINKIAEVFYDSMNISLYETINSQIGQVLIEGKIHPTADRRKYISGYVAILEPLPNNYHKPKIEEQAHINTTGISNKEVTIEFAPNIKEDEKLKVEIDDQQDVSHALITLLNQLLVKSPNVTEAEIKNQKKIEKILKKITSSNASINITKFLNGIDMALENKKSKKKRSKNLLNSSGITLIIEKIVIYENS